MSIINNNHIQKLGILFTSQLEYKKRGYSTNGASRNINVRVIIHIKTIVKNSFIMVLKEEKYLLKIFYVLLKSNS